MDSNFNNLPPPFICPTHGELPADLVILSERRAGSIFKAGACRQCGARVTENPAFAAESARRAAVHGPPQM